MNAERGSHTCVTSSNEGTWVLWEGTQLWSSVPCAVRAYMASTLRLLQTSYAEDAFGDVSPDKSKSELVTPLFTPQPVSPRH